MKKANKREIILAEWQTCVEMANSVSQRRDTMNNIFITVNTALLAAVSLRFDIKTVFILISGIVLCVIWKLLIRNYKILNRVKFEIIQEMEEGLPVRAFHDEWERLCSDRKYKDGTSMEKSIPILFIIIYVLAIIVMILLKYFIAK